MKEFYTPKSIVNLIAEMLEPYKGIIYDPAYGSGGGDEYKIRKKLIDNDLVEAILILPQNMFYTTNISATLWILNKNKKEQKAKLNGLTKNFRDRKHKILFMDLRKLGVPFEKKFIQFSDEDIERIASTYHNWQIKDGNYKDVPEFCYSAKIDEALKKDYSLVPSKYIEFVNRDENIAEKNRRTVKRRRKI